jgi:hypothetical protein
MFFFDKCELTDENSIPVGVGVCGQVFSFHTFRPNPNRLQYRRVEIEVGQ